MADSDRVVSAIAALISANTSAYNVTLLVGAATATITPSPARLAGIYALSSTTGTTSVTGFQAENGSALSLTFASALSGPLFNPSRPVLVTNLIANTNTAADLRKILFVWQSA